MNISAKTNVLAVVGNPIRHSLSPKIHNFLSEKLGLDYVYTAFEPETMDGVTQALRTLGIRGINVTAPFKYKALELVDEVCEDAKIGGSVNTIVNKNGVLVGHSTDGEGLFLSMKRAGIEIENKKILVLGAGGAAKPVCVMLKNKGAAAVTVKNRTVSRAEELCSDLNSQMKTDIFSSFKEKSVWDVIINTTSVGMGTDETPLPEYDFFDGAAAAVDLIYYPAKTKFLETAESRGLKTLNGLGMLVFQGVIAYEYFTDTKVPETLYEEVLSLVYE